MGFWHCARSNRTPSAASRSSPGVWTSVGKSPHDVHLALCWSAMIHSTFGRSVSVSGMVGHVPTAA
jgi:hypothetical protein